MKIKKGIAVILAAGMMLNSTACTMHESLPEETIEAYEDAYNEMDIQAMLDCLDEKSVKSITTGVDAVMGIAGAVTGVDLGISASDLIDMAPLIQAVMGQTFAAQMGSIPQVDFQVKETYIKGSRATVYFTEANSSQEMGLNMIKEKGKWYITLSTIMISKEDADRVIIAGEEEKKGRGKGKRSEKERFGKADKKDAENAEDTEKKEDALSKLFGTDRIKEAVSDVLDSDE